MTIKKRERNAYFFAEISEDERIRNERELVSRSGSNGVQQGPADHCCPDGIPHSVIFRKRNAGGQPGGNARQEIPGGRADPDQRNLQ